MERISRRTRVKSFCRLLARSDRTTHASISCCSSNKTIRCKTQPRAAPPACHYKQQQLRSRRSDVTTIYARYDHLPPAPVLSSRLHPHPHYSIDRGSYGNARHLVR